MRYERVSDRIAPTHVFVARVVSNTIWVAILVAASLGAGMWGYHTYEHMPWIDAFANAAMILSGMGPLASPQTWDGKLFAGAYALYSGLFVIVAAGLLLAPALHRFLHQLHLDDDRD